MVESTGTTPQIVDKKSQTLSMGHHCKIEPFLAEIYPYQFSGFAMSSLRDHGVGLLIRRGEQEVRFSSWPRMVSKNGVPGGNLDGCPPGQHVRNTEGEVFKIADCRRFSYFHSLGSIIVVLLSKIGRRLAFEQRRFYNPHHHPRDATNTSNRSTSGSGMVRTTPDTL
jgi:hypothetical protein